MLILVTGGSCSGKSGFAEELLEKTGADVEKYYIATMEARDDESQARVHRHRVTRAGKGFVTIEQARDVQQVSRQMTGRIDGRMRRSGRRAALLECMSNLAANEMFGGDEIRGEDEISEKICLDILSLAEQFEVFIIVTNNVFEDGGMYDEGTQAYLRALGEINVRLAGKADLVYEVVVGIPVLIGGRQGVE